MKSLTWLTESILLESGMRCGANPARDLIEVRHRVKHEGESFLTITLPNFGNAFDRAIDEGRLVPSATTCFRWHRKGLPEFLRGFLVLVFHRDGQLLSEPNAEAILCVRQICYLHKKVLRPCTESKNTAALRKFKECENDLENHQPTNHALLHAFGFASRVVWSELLRGFPEGDPRSSLHPKHGPGSTRERVLGNAKYNITRWHERLEDQFPFTEYGIASLRNLGEADCPLNRVEFVEPQDEEPVRVVFVPKTQKTPRVIAIEPVCMQYMQQSLLEVLVPAIERGAYTGGRVNFVDQSINGKLALTASKDQKYATLDLSEASDRVSLDLVLRMLDGAPIFRDLVLACRSTRAELPDGSVMTLRKFASMGSALCFPMEAMVFFLTIVADRLVRAKLPLTSRNVMRMSSDLYIYGDDIIVPTDEAPFVSMALQDMCLKVNSAKSFWTGKFRESCGTDAYDGTDVTPTYVRHEQPTNKHDAEALVAWVAMANQFYMKGFWQTTRRIRNVIEKVLGKLPHLGGRAPGLYWINYSKSIEYKRWCSNLMRFETRTWVPRPRQTSDPLDGDGALLKCFRIIGNTVSGMTDHLLRSVARGKLALNYRWVPAL